MTDGVVPVAPPPYKNRRGWLVAFGIFEILIGCVLLGMIALSVFAMRMASAAPPPTVPCIPPPAVVMAIIAVFYGLLAVLFVTVGIGSIQAKRWARMAMLVISWCWLAMGVMGMAMMAIMLPMIMESAKQQAKSPMPPGFDTAFQIGMLVVLGAFFVVLPLIFVLFYSGKNVKATCENRSGVTPSGPRRPVVVIVVAVWYAMSAVSCVTVLLVIPAFPLFGFVLMGWSARVAAIVVGGLCAWLAWNLYHQRALAWRVAIGWLVIGLASMLVTQSRLGVVEMYRRMGYSELEIGRMMPLVSYGLYGGVIFGVAFLVFLIAIRRQFNDPSAVPATN
jgi:hypothetical protein